MIRPIVVLNRSHYTTNRTERERVFMKIFSSCRNVYGSMSYRFDTVQYAHTFTFSA